MKTARKQKAASTKKKASPKASAGAKTQAGRLIALEGTRGQDVADVAPRLLRRLRGETDGGISRWDASGTFFEMRLGKSKLMTPSPRTLLLLYASDLAFRLRWEIQPALDEGQWVVAVPYVETAVAFGTAAGLSTDWLNELFSFAPEPSRCFRVKEKKKRSGWKARPTAGYLEFCSAALMALSAKWDPSDLRKKCIEYLQSLERRGQCEKVGKVVS